MNIRKTVAALSVLLLLLAVSFFSGYWCKSKYPEQVYLPGKVTVTFYKYYVDSTNHTTVKNNFNTVNAYTVTPQSIDTSAIIKLFFTKRFVADSLKDSLICITTLDTLFNNNITYRKQTYRRLKPYKVVETTTTTITNSIPATVSQNGFYLGSYFGFNQSLLQSAGVEADYVTKKINYGLGYDFKNNAVTGKLLFRINKK